MSQLHLWCPKDILDKILTLIIGQKKKKGICMSQLHLWYPKDILGKILTLMTGKKARRVQDNSWDE